jgi:hypothetical protein
MVLDFLLGLCWTLLPARIREQRLRVLNANIRYSAVVSGVGQSLALLGIQVARYFHFMNYRLGGLSEALIERDAASIVSGESVQFGMGFVSLVEFLIQPLTIVIIYFMIEGAVRFSAAMITGEIVGTLPLVLADKAVQLVQERRDEQRKGEIVPDLVAPAPVEGSGYELSVASCRAKPNWDHLMTVAYQDGLYEVADYIEAAPPRRHVYLLRRAPEHKVVRGLHPYDPDEILKG